MTAKSIAVRSINIVGLFDIFNYDVSYPENENVLIITGPNGYGKTQILNILSNLFARKFDFFEHLVFKKITVTLNNDTSIEISKKQSKKQESIIFDFFKDGNDVDTYTYSPEHFATFLNEFDVETIRRFFAEKHILKDNKDDDSSIDSLRNREIRVKKKLYIKSPEVNAILNSINVHLIKEQRLFKKVVNPRDSKNNGDIDQTVMIETIQTYADELKQLISERIQESYKITQNLDRSYPNRLISEKNKVSKAEYDVKFTQLKEKQDKLVKNGLSEGIQEALEYSEDDAKALLVYLNDLEQKTNVFDELLEKLELFTKILNERRFTFKSINISRDKGFFFKTTTGSELALNQLSSGEQHEVVLLYELIFKTSPSILVLIDEPEISLHITWQKEFLDDLLKIIKLQNFQVLIATHSPSIINDRWDLVFNLEKTDD